MRPVAYTRALIGVGVRFAGLVMLAVALPQCGFIFGRIITAFGLGYGWDFLSLSIDHGANEDPTSWLGWMALLGLGLYVLIGGGWVTRMICKPLSNASGRTCTECGYDMQRVRAPRCPECGTPTGVPA